MAIDIYTPQFMLAAVQQIKPRPTFLKDRYFPDGATFATEKVLADYKDGSNKISPYISPRRGGITMYREGFETMELQPPMTGEKTVLTADDLKRRNFGEALFSGMTPAERQQKFMVNDLKEMSDRIKGRWEAMAAECMLNNAITGKIYADEIGGDKFQEFEIKYYKDDNDAVYTPAHTWDQAEANIIDDLYNMAQMLAARGLPAVDFVCAPNVAAQIRKNQEIRELLDIRRAEYGGLKPEQLTNGATLIGVLNADGFMLNIIAYAAEYTDETGQKAKYIKDGYGVVTAPGAGEAIYGAVTQIEQGMTDFVTREGILVPKYIADANNNTKTIQLVSCPLLKPVQKSPWIAAQLL